MSRNRHELFTRLYSQTVTVTASPGHTVRLDTDTSPGKCLELCGLSVCPKHVRAARAGGPGRCALRGAAVLGDGAPRSGACASAPPAAVDARPNPRRRAELRRAYAVAESSSVNVSSIVAAISCSPGSIGISLPPDAANAIVEARWNRGSSGSLSLTSRPTRAPSPSA